MGRICSTCGERFLTRASYNIHIAPVCSRSGETQRYGTLVVDEVPMQVVGLHLRNGCLEVIANVQGPLRALHGAGWVLFGADGAMVISNVNHQKLLDTPRLEAHSRLKYALSLTLTHEDAVQ
jgi:hypothetical protein